MTNRKTVDVPELDHDAMMLAKYQHKVSPGGRLERRIVAALCAHLIERGWTPCEVYDGDTTTRVHDAKSAMELIFNLDESHLYFSNGERKHRVFLVGGNGIDIISDWTFDRGSYGEGDNSTTAREGTFAAAMDAFDPEEYA